MKKTIAISFTIAAIALFAVGCGAANEPEKMVDIGSMPIVEPGVDTIISMEEEEKIEDITEPVIDEPVKIEGVVDETTVVEEVRPESEVIDWNSDWTYAEFSELHGNSIIKYNAQNNPKKITVCVNAGHGSPKGNDYYVLCHPDGSPKLISGSTSEGKTKAVSIASGTEFLDGTPENEATLSLAMILKDLLLENGYDVLMIREDCKSQLDNIARTVYANQKSDCHIALHYDSTDYDKGAFYMSVPQIDSYLNMSPVCDHWREHEALGAALIQGLEKNDRKIFNNGSLPTDLVQMSFSTVPSIDIEVGDRASDHSNDTQSKIARGILDGLNIYFEQE